MSNPFIHNIENNVVTIDNEYNINETNKNNPFINNNMIINDIEYNHNEINKNNPFISNNNNPFLNNNGGSGPFVARGPSPRDGPLLVEVKYKNKSVSNKDLINFIEEDPIISESNNNDNEIKALKLELIKLSIQMNSKFDMIKSLMENLNNKLDIIEFKIVSRNN